MSNILVCGEHSKTHLKSEMQNKEFEGENEKKCGLNSAENSLCRRDENQEEKSKLERTIEMDGVQWTVEQ